jgi:hypothetical protein
MYSERCAITWNETSDLSEAHNQSLQNQWDLRGDMRHTVALTAELLPLMLGPVIIFAGPVDAEKSMSKGT